MEVLKYAILIFAITHNFHVFAEKENENMAESIVSDISSPFTTPARFILYGGVLANSLTYLNHTKEGHDQHESFKDAPPLGEGLTVVGNVIGYGLLNVSYVAWASWYGLKYDNPKMLKNAEVMARASLYSSGATFLLKKSISQKRPGFPDDDNSFPSGHASFAFSFASVVTARHGWFYGSGAHALAGFIAVSRVNDDFHYLHDILAGITIGAAFGWGVHYNMEKRNNTWFTLIPTPQKGMGIAVGWSF